VKVQVENITTCYHVNDDGKHYRVIHYQRLDEWARNHGHADEWRVKGAQGIHSFARDLDPDKPRFKQIVEAVKLDQED